MNVEHALAAAGYTSQRIFDLVKDMECDPDDDLGSAITLSHTILGKFPTLT